MKLSDYVVPVETRTNPTVRNNMLWRMFLDGKLKHIGQEFSAIYWFHTCIAGSDPPLSAPEACMLAPARVWSIRAMRNNASHELFQYHLERCVGWLKNQVSQLGFRCKQRYVSVCVVSLWGWHECWSPAFHVIVLVFSAGAARWFQRCNSQLKHREVLVLTFFRLSLDLHTFILYTFPDCKFVFLSQ